MTFSEDREQHNVMPKIIDCEEGIQIEIKKDRLYKLRKSTKIVKPTKETQSPFSEMDHIGRPPPLMETDIILEEYSDIFMTETVLTDTLEETNVEEV